MTYEEAVCLMKQGKMVRRNNGVYFIRDGKSMCLVIDFYPKDKDTRIDIFLIDSDIDDFDRNATDWEVVG